jgi:hypothetical protein
MAKLTPSVPRVRNSSLDRALMCNKYRSNKPRVHAFQRVGDRVKPAVQSEHGETARVSAVCEDRQFSRIRAHRLRAFQLPDSAEAFGNGRVGRLLIAFMLHHGGVLSKPLMTRRQDTDPEPLVIDRAAAAEIPSVDAIQEWAREERGAIRSSSS